MEDQRNIFLGMGGFQEPSQNRWKTVMKNGRLIKKNLVGGLVAIFYFPIYIIDWEFHHPN